MYNYTDNEGRITIKDISEKLGVSTATISNVIHGKTKKVSKETIEKVQNALEESGYIPNMAAVLLAQNSSKIVCVVLSDDKKYNGKMIEDSFVSGIINGISKGLQEMGYFMMLKEEKDISKIAQYASMWNMAGLILLGYCENNYEELRKKIRIPLVVIDGYSKKVSNYGNVGIDNFDGGYKAGEYLIKKGHRKIMFLSDNDLCGDHERYEGFKRALLDNGINHQVKDFKLLPMNENERYDYLNQLIKNIKEYTAAFCASDVYAIEVMNFLTDNNISIPEEISIMGFDNIPACELVRPRLTTVEQNINDRAICACELLHKLINKIEVDNEQIIAVNIVERDSVKKIRYDS